MFAISRTIGDLVNCAVDRETNNGRGSEDFKFSFGCDKTIVEIKNSSSSRLMHGYETQIEQYVLSEQTTNRIYLVVVDEFNENLKNLKENHAINQGNQNNPPDLVLVESFKIEPASIYKKDEE